MKQKQFRSISPEAAYPLPQQEYTPPRVTPYCKVRALAKLLGISLVQSREDLTTAVNRRLFFDSGFVKPKTKDLQKHYEAEAFGSLKLSEDRSEMELNLIADTEEPKSLSAIFNSELWSLQRPKLAAEELYKCLGNFTRPNMIFYNCSRDAPFLSNLTPIIYLPYVPGNVNTWSENVLKLFAKHLRLFAQYEETSKYDILRQKFKDLFYLVEDHSDLHLITPCQAYLKNCRDIASEYCANHMCKLCCQTSGYKLPCHMHSEQSSLFRLKYFWRHRRISLLLSAQKQWQFDGERTLRVRLRNKLGLKDLQGRLNKFDIVFTRGYE